MDGARLTDNSIEFQVRTKEDRIYHFSKDLARINAQGATEYGIWRIADLCGNWLDFDWQDGRVVGIDESAGRRIEIVSEDGRITEVALSIPGQDFRHVFVRYEYDEAGGPRFRHRRPGQSIYVRATTSITWSVTPTGGASPSTTSMTRTAARDGAWSIRGAMAGSTITGSRTTIMLNERRITDSLGHVSLVKLDERGLPISEIDPLGGMTVFEYDEAGRTTCGRRSRRPAH